MANCKVPYRLRVLQKLTKHLEGINPLNGYQFNLSEAVFRGRSLFGDESPKTMVSIIENPRPDYGTFVGNDQGRLEGWVLLLQGTTEQDNGEHPLDRLYYLAADVENRLAAIVAEKADGSGRPAFPEVYMLGRDKDTGSTLITGLEIGPPVVRPPTEATQRASFYMALRVGLAEVWG
jgi:hypothetical protein